MPSDALTVASVQPEPHNSEGRPTCDAALASTLTSQTQSRRRRLLPVVSHDQRRGVLTSLFGDTGAESWFWVRYAVMLALSVVIAAAGLSAGSTAVVIGAMLIAPLMTPLLGVTVAASLGLRRRTRTALVVLAASTVGAIALAAAIAWMLPDTPLTAETLARTAPDVRDLIVALAAGAAGAWATARADVSTTLPGVAIAVALVPPLSSIGICLEAGRWDLAEGAALLYITNVVAISGAAAVVLVLAGFVPAHRIRHAGKRLLIGMAATAAAILLLSQPLWDRAASIADQADAERVTADVITTWLQPTPALEATSVRRSGNNVVVDVVGPVAPPGAEMLAEALGARLGERIDVQVRWSQVHDDTNGHTVDDSDEAAVELQTISRITDEWAAELGFQGTAVESVSVDNDVVTVRVAGPKAPPAGSSLERHLTEEGIDLNAVVLWTEVRVVDDTAVRTSSLHAAATTQARIWAEHHDLTVVDVAVTGDRVTVVVAGETQPVSSEELVVEIRAAANDLGVDDLAAVDVRFSPQLAIPLTPTTTTTTEVPYAAIAAPPTPAANSTTATLTASTGADNSTTTSTTAPPAATGPGQ